MQECKKKEHTYNQKGGVLVVATTPLRIDGLTAMLVRIAQIVDEDQTVQFALGEEADPSIINRLKQIGQVYELPSRKRSLLRYMTALNRLIKDKQYTAIHIHGNSATMALDLLCCLPVKIRITHCHNCKPQPWLKQKTLGLLLNRLVTKPVSCSLASGEMLYSGDFTVITNGINCERFRFDQKMRNETRSQLGLEGRFVIGHVGRFTAQKNQGRLIRIFRQLKKKNPNASLLLIGEGEDREACIQAVKEYGLQQDVVFLTRTDHPEEYYAAMDVLVMPSLFEGLPLTGVEAQANGLPCVFSDAITREADIAGNNRFLSLEENDTVWEEAILQASAKERESAADIVKTKGFDEKKMKEQVVKLYE